LLEGAKLEFINRSVRRHLARRGFWVLGAIVIIGLLAYLAATSSQRAILRSRSFYESAQRSLVERDYASAEIAATDALIDEDRFSTRQTLLDSRVLAFRKTWEVRTKSVLAVCSDGTVGALKQNENQIEFVSINSNNMLFAPPLEPSTITRATFGSSGNLLVYGTRDGHVRRWDPISKRLDSPNSLPNNHEIASVACSADGAEVLFCTEKGPEPLGKAELWIWHTSSGSIERVAETDSIYWALAWDSTDDRFVAGGNDYAITLFEKKEGEWVKQYQSVVADDVIATVSFSPDGTNIITAGSDNLVRLLDAKTGVEIRRFTGHLNDVLQAQFIDDGSLIVSAGYDGTVKIWDTVSGVNLWTIRLNESISSFSVSADDKLTVGCERGCISVFQRSGSGLYRRLGDCGSPCSVVSAFQIWPSRIR
jgi:WD40 repeat protein